MSAPSYERTRWSRSIRIRLRHPGDRDRDRRDDDDEPEPARIDPHEARADDQEIHDAAEKPRRDAGHPAHGVDGVNPVRHVGDRPALEVPVGEARDLREERDADARLELSPDPERGAGGGELERHEHDEQDEHHDEPARALFDEAEVAPHLDEAAHQQGFDRATEGGARQRQDQGGRRERTILAQELDELAERANRHFVQRGLELGIERRRVGLSRADARHANEHGAASEHLGRSILRGVVRASAPVGARDRVGIRARRFGERGDEPTCRAAAVDPPALHERGHEPDGGVERGERRRGGIGPRRFERPFGLAPRADRREPPSQRRRELVRPCPVAPRLGRQRHRVVVEVGDDLVSRQPLPPAARVRRSSRGRR